MSKLRLDPEDLRVQSFAVGPATAGQGTVRAHACSVAVPQDPYPRDGGGGEGGGGGGATSLETCAATCDASCWGSCAATCGDYTCDAAQLTCYEPNPP